MNRTSAQDILDKLYYIQIPGDMIQKIQDFPLDPQIRIPVDGGGESPEELQKNLSWERILSGLLKIMTWDRSHPHLKYFRDLTLYLRPDILRELSAAGIHQASEQNWDLAEEIFLALEGLDPDNPRVLLNQALLYDQYHGWLEDKDQEEELIRYKRLTKERYSRALACEEPVVDASLYAGMFALRTGDLEAAKGHLDHFQLISQDAEKKERARKALQDFQEQAAIDLLFKESYDFIQLGQEDVALQRIGLFLEKQPDIWNAWFLKGWAHRRLEQFAEGKLAFEKALELGGTRTDTYNELALCLMELKDYKGARKQLSQALSRDPENTKIITNLGILAHKMGQTSEAEGFFRTSLEYNPQDQVALQYLQKISQN